MSTHSESFRALHAGGAVLVLANAWDAASARLVELAGGKAVATSSAAVSWAHGFADGEHLGREAVLTVTRELVRAVRVPVSIDLEAGYSAEPASVAALAHDVIEAGAVGVNLEDGSDAPELLAAKIVSIKKAAAAMGADVFINARTDVYLRNLVPAERAVEETLRRARLYEAAGCDGLFVPLAVDEASIRAITGASRVPVNVLALPGLAPVAELGRWGIRRLSLGTAVAAAALATVRTAVTDVLTTGTYDTLFRASISGKEMNTMFSPSGGAQLR
jgi:2-methylisocitrate lyase-like PEP mutase family enzyme